MAREKKKSFIARLLFPPVIVFLGVVALWENEGRFDYGKAAQDATVIESPSAAEPDVTVAFTGGLDTEIAIDGEYIQPLTGYYTITRRAEIYAWDRNEDSDGKVTWSQGWDSSVESNSRNSGVVQTLSSATLYPPVYRLADLEIAPSRIHFVDGSVSLSTASVELNERGLGADLVAENGYLHKRLKGGDGGPAVGDERLSYSAIPVEPTATYFGLIADGVGVGKQHEVSGGFVSALIGNDGILHHLVNGERSVALATVKSHFKRLKWIVRTVGTLAIVMGIYFFFSGFVNLLYRIPLIGNFISSGVFLISALLGLIISVMVMFASAFVHHPLVVALPTMAFIGVIFWFRRRQGQARTNVAATLANHQSGASSSPPPPATTISGIGIRGATSPARLAAGFGCRGP